MKQLLIVTLAGFLTGCATTDGSLGYFSTSGLLPAGIDPVDVSVIQSLVVHVVDRSGPVVVARRPDDVRNLSAQTCNSPALSAEAEASGLPRHLLLQIVRRTCEANQLPVLPPDTRYVVEVQDDLARIGTRSSSPAKAFSRSYPNANGILQLALPAYTDDHAQAVTQVVVWSARDWGCSLSGVQSLIMLGWQADGWKVIQETKPVEIVLINGGCDPSSQTSRQDNVYVLTNKGRAWAEPWP